MRYQLCALIAAVAVAACGSPGGDGGPPDVADPYQAQIDEAWEIAGEGSSPTGTCATVIGTGVGRASQDAAEQEAAREAYRACYVDVRARFVEAYTDEIEAGEEECTGLMMSLVGSSGGLSGYADDLGADIDSLDAEFEERVGDQVRKACPDMADAIL